MKKRYIVLIIVAAIIAAAMVLAPVALLVGGMIWDEMSGDRVEIEIDSYRLCEGENGEDVIIIKYLLKNGGEETTTLFWEGDFYAYQNGVGLTEYTKELPPECHYDPEDQYKNIKGGVEYYAEIAYQLEYPDQDVEVEVDDYGLFAEAKKEKVFTINE